MNCKEHHLPELELSTSQVKEALQAILHTILFIRSPGGPVAPLDVNCEGFHWTYTRIAYDDIKSLSGNKQHYLDKKVDSGIEDFFKNLTQIGPELLSVSI